MGQEKELERRETKKGRIKGDLSVEQSRTDSKLKHEQRVFLLKENKNKEGKKL